MSPGEAMIGGRTDRIGAVAARARPPAPAPWEITREALLRRIEVDPAPLTVLAGPAGAGKTSLLTSWAARVTADGGIVAWFGLEQYDDAVTPFWSGVLGALRATGRFDPQSRLNEFVPPPLEVSPAFVDAIVDALAELDEPLWLVLDDVHYLTDPAVVASLELLVRHLHPELRLVLSGRGEPPLPLARLRVEGRVRELRDDDLAFTRDEVAEVVARQGIDLSQGAVTALHDRTEGWPVGVRIAMLALEQSDDVAGQVVGFQGDDQELADYLLTEVLANIPAAGRRFLLATGVCRDVSVGFARVLTGREDAGDLLDGLVREGAFVRHVGRDRSHFRFHELFRGFLMAELHHTDPAWERELHRQAARWFASQGEPLHAMEHLVQAGEQRQVVEFAREHGVGVILDGRGSELVAVLDLLGRAARSEPWLALLATTAGLVEEDLGAADRWLVGVDLQALTDDVDPWLGALAAIVAVARARVGSGIGDALTRLEASPACSTGQHDLDLLGRYQRGVARLYVGRDAEAYDDLEVAAEAARRSERPAIRVSCLSFLSGVASSLSRYVEMRQLAEQVLELGEELGWGRSQAVMLAHVHAGWSAYLRGDVAAADYHAEAAMTSLGSSVEPDFELACRALSLISVHEGGDIYERLRSLQRSLDRLLRGQRAPVTLASLGPVFVRLCLQLGERELARTVARSLIDGMRDPGEHALIRALLLEDAGKEQAAHHQLEAIVGGSSPCHTAVAEVSALVFAAELEARRGNAALAHDRMLRAIVLAEPRELVRPFLDRSAVGALLAAGEGRFGRHETFVREILARVRGAAGAPDNDRARLTPAELEILRELPSLLTARDIAEARSVSVNTVKSHMKAIYRKLGVDTRRETVEEARRRGLL
jgi:LuxR family transcriptional regulator, maltose regulon positive regulatory protein